MAGILGRSSSDSTCNVHNVMRNVSGYACGVTFTYKDPANPPKFNSYAAVELQECCAMAGSPVLRIPGNTGCEMQFCEVPGAMSTYTTTEYNRLTSSTTSIETLTLTVSGTVTTTTTSAVVEVIQTPTPSTRVVHSEGPPDDIETCMAMVSEGDLPDDIAEGVASTGNWCIAGTNDDSLSADDDDVAVTASAAPASWTEASFSSAGAYWSSVSAAEASPTSTTEASPSSTAESGTSDGVGRGEDLHWLTVVSVLFAGFTVAF